MAHFSEDGEALLRRWWWRHLQEDDLIIRKNQGWGAKNAQGIHSKGMVFGKSSQQLTVAEVFLKSGYVKVNTLSSFNQGINISDVPLPFVLCPK